MANTLEIIVQGTDKTSKVFGKLSADLDKMGKKMQVTGAIIMGIGAGVVGGIFKMADSYTKAGDEIAKMSKRTGIAVQTLSELKYMADLSGTSLEAMESSIRMMQRGITDANMGLGEAKEAFGALGIELETIIGLSPEDQFWALATAVSEVADPSQRAALAMDIFGRSGTALLPVLADGAAGITKMKQEAHDLNLIFDEESAEASEKFQDAKERIGKALQGLSAQIVTDLTPKLTDMLEKMTAVVGKIMEWTKANPGLAETIMQVGIVLIGAGGLIFALGSIARTIVAVNTALVIMHGLMGPAGWIKLAAGIAVAGGALVAINKITEYTTKDTTKVITGGIQTQLTANLKAIETRKIAVQSEYNTAIDNIRKVYGVEQATSLNKIELARKASDETRKLLNRDLDAARKASSERLSLLTKEYDAKFRVLNIETEAILGDYQTRLDNLDELTEAEDKIIRESERQKREEELRTEVARATTASERLDAEKRLADYLTQMGRERSREQIEAAKATIRAEMEEVRKSATQKRDVLQAELDDKKEKERLQLAATEDRIEGELAGLQDALKEKLRMLDIDLKQHEENERLKLQATLNRLDQERIAMQWKLPGFFQPAPTPPPYIPGEHGTTPLGGGISPTSLPPNVPGMPEWGSPYKPIPVLAHAGETFLGVGQRTLPELSGGSSSFLSEERNTIVNINVGGSVVTERELAEVIRKAFYDIRRHNFTLEMA